MEVHLNRDSFVDQRSGEVSEPAEFLSNLRSIETSLERVDTDIIALKSDLKVAREAREKLVAQLRECVREGRVLPLFEQTDDELEVDEN